MHTFVCEDVAMSCEECVLGRDLAFRFEVGVAYLRFLRAHGWIQEVFL